MQPTRRAMLKTLVAGGFAIGFAAPLGGLAQRAAAASTTTAAVGTWVRIRSDGVVTVLVGSSEMGQGVYTSLAQLVAEELHVAWADIRVAPAPADSAYANPATGAQLTGGSMSVRGYFTALRTAGAAVRDMLRAAAAQQFGVAVSKCVARNGRVYVRGTTRSAGYGELAAAAAKLPVPTNPALAPASAWRIIGTAVPRVDVPAKTRGAAVYGIDVRVPAMKHAIVVHAPAVGGSLASVGAKPRGVAAVVKLKNAAGVVDAIAVVAATTWDAMTGLENLDVSWRAPANAAQLSSSAISAQASSLMNSGTPVVADSSGDASSAVAAATKGIDAVYEVPYLAHAAMEPLACTASVTPGHCELWAPTQAPGLAAQTAAAVCGIDPAQVTVHTTLLGGGLGRKFENDFVSQAVQISKAVAAPVKLTWPREQDFGHDQYRPMAQIRIRAGLAGGTVHGWSDRIVSPSILFQRGWIPDGAVDSQAVEGATELPYAIADRLVEYVRHPAAVPVGFWRSVGHSFNAFAVECAIDELAQLAGADPVAFRQTMLAGNPRASAVLQKVADLAGWGASVPAGRARGVALSAAFGSIVAQIAEVSSPAAGRIKVERVWCAIDCGQVVNPSIVEAQMQGGIVHGLTAALWGRMTFTNGVAGPVNFNRYRMTRMRDMPRVEVAIMASAQPPGGVGEPGVPPIAPAVANAWSRLTGTRVRSLPLQ
ncbi:MAG TPA: molybdopterin cofactor-binding domain-containing protein [Jatrophihabitans sp.]